MHRGGACYPAKQNYQAAPSTEGDIRGMLDDSIQLVDE